MGCKVHGRVIMMHSCSYSSFRLCPKMSDNFFQSCISNYFLHIFNLLFIINYYNLHFLLYFSQSKILSDICGRRTFWGPTYVPMQYTATFTAVKPTTIFILKLFKINWSK